MSPEPEVKVVTIDFGTAFSKAAVAPRVSGRVMSSKMEVLEVGAVAGANAPFLVPSTICLLNQQIYFGPTAAVVANGLSERREALQSFKLLLGAADLAALLSTTPPRKIDPEATFTYRELIVLFLAYFIDLTELAMGGVDLAAPNSGCVVRYTRPGWFSNRTSRDHAEIGGLLQHGKAVLRRLGSGFWQLPLSYSAAQAAIRESSPDTMLTVESGVFEATASASCHLMLTGERMGIIILDIGAGTCDIEAFLLSEVGAPPSRIGNSRLTLSIAGDNIDRVLLNVLTMKAKGARSLVERSEVWRSLLPSVRVLKSKLFEDGHVSISIRPGITTQCKLRDLTGSKEYKRIVKAISNAYRELAEAAAQECQRHGLRELRSVATGGGAALPFVQDLLRKTRPRVKGVRFSRLESVPNWVKNLSRVKEVEPVFNQLAVVIGGAIAPQNLLIIPDPPRSRHPAELQRGVPST